MRNKCTKCNKELGEYDYGKCYDCKKKEDRNALIAIAVIIMLALGIGLGCKVLWAKFVYKDARCAFAECRINVNPK